MVDALRAALRLLPAVRPSVRGISGASFRVPKARIHSCSEQSTLLALKVYPEITNCEKPQQGETGIARFARAVLAYVGAGLSAVTANQLAGPSILQAKDIGSTDSRGMWQRTSSNRHLVNEDVIRSSKFMQCPLPHVPAKSQADTCHVVGPSYYWSNNSWGSVDARFSPDARLDLQWQFSPGAQREYRSKLGIHEENLNARFPKPAGLQALAAESKSSLKSCVGSMGTVSDYHAAAELELEWQSIVDPQPKSGMAGLPCDSKICEGHEEVLFEETVNSNSELDEPATNKQVNNDDIGTSEIMTKSSKEVVAPSGCHYGDHAHKKQVVESEQGFGSHETSRRQDGSRISTMKSSVAWRTADKEARSSMVAQKATESMEKCHLPTSQTGSMTRMSLASFDIIPSADKQEEMSRSLDKNLLASLLHGSEPSRLENLGLPASNLGLGSSVPTTSAPLHFHRVSQPLTIPSSEVPSSRRSHNLSSDNRNTSWNGGGTIKNRGSGLLGEALCHSQTRAREAENKVKEVYEEKAKLVGLFFREASLSLTYRHWVTALQAENMWLRMYARNEPFTWLHCSVFDPFSAVERMSSRRWKNFSQDYARRQMEHHISAMYGKDRVNPVESNDIMMGCKLGFAFALGLSLAGAGLMLGWSMGWILLAYSVSV